MHFPVLYHNYRSRRASLFAGVVVVILASTIFLVATHATSYLVYPGALLLGVGSTIIIVVSHSMANDLVGHRVTTGAFVFGAFSLIEKLAKGLIILYIQLLKQGLCPDTDDGSDLVCAEMIRCVLVYVPVITALIASFASWFLKADTKATAPAVVPEVVSVGSLQSEEDYSSEEGTWTSSEGDPSPARKQRRRKRKKEDGIVTDGAYI